MLSKQDFLDISKKVFAMSSAQEVELMLSGSNSSLTRIANNEITQNVSAAEDSITIRVVSDKKTGRASLTKFDDASLEEAVKAAEAIMKYAKPDSDYVSMQGSLPIPEGPCTYFERTATFGPEERAAIVSRLASKCKAAGCEAAGIVSNGEYSIGIANNFGLFIHHQSTSGEFSVTVAAEDVSGWAETERRNISDIQFDKLVDSAIETWASARKPQSLEPGEHTVILPPHALADFILFLTWIGFGPVGYHEGTSPLAGKIGTKIFGDNITLVDDYSHPLSLGLPFDFEGSPRSKMTLVENGVMKSMVYDRRSAQKYGTKPTGHGLPQPNTYGAFPGNIIMSGGDSSLEKMIAETKNGVLLTHVHYTNLLKQSDMTLTGMTRDGVFVVKDGRVSHPVKNLRFTDSIFRVLNNVSAISKDVEQVAGFFGGSFVLPAVKVDGFRFTSSTEF